MTDRFRDTLKHIYTASSDREQPPSPPPPPFSRSDLRSLLIRIESLESQLSDLSQRLDSLEQTISSLRDVVDRVNSVLELRPVLEQLVQLLQSLDFSSLGNVAEELTRVEQLIAKHRRDLDELLRFFVMHLPLDAVLEKVGTLSEEELSKIDFDGAYSLFMGADGFYLVDRAGNMYRYDPKKVPPDVLSMMGISPLPFGYDYKPPLRMSRWKRRRRNNDGGGSSA